VLRGPDGALELRAHSGTRNDWPADYSASAKNGILAQAFDARMKRSSQRRWHRPNGPPPLRSGSELCVPLISFAETLGALLVIHPEANFFTVDDRSIAQAATDVSANAIRNVQLSDELRRVSNTDSLTGVYNQRYFHIALGLETGRARRYRGTFSVVLLDIGAFDISIPSPASMWETSCCAHRDHSEAATSGRRCDLSLQWRPIRFGVAGDEVAAGTQRRRQVAPSDRVPPSAHLNGEPFVQAASAIVNYPEESDNEMELVRTLLSRLAESKNQSPLRASKACNFHRGLSS